VKAIKHSHHEQYLRLSNDDAALLVSSGRWVFVSKFEARAATQRPARPLWLRIGMFVTTLAMIIAALLLSTSAKAANLPVPYKVCLTQAQAAQVYKGQRLKYREVGKERCWYAGKTLPKHAFHSRAGAEPSNVGSKPTRSPQRLSGPDSTDGRTVCSIPATGATNAHPTGVAVSLSRLDTQDTPRAEGQSSSILEVSDRLQAMAADAYLALTGRPESDYTFDAMWHEMTGWMR
jgi:hypothetical protein